MKNFNVSNVRRYKSGEALECLNLVADSYAKVSSLPEKLAKRAQELKAAVDELDKIFNETTAEETTAKLLALDKDRLSVLQSMKFYAKAMQKRSDPEKARMGELLIKVLEHNTTNIYNESYPQKTSLINAFLKDVHASAEITACIESFNLTGEVETLTQQNLAFTQLFDTSAQEKKDPFNTLEKREVAREIFAKLVEETQAFAITSDDPAIFEQLLKNTKKLLQKFDKPVLLRKSLRNKSNEVVTETTIDSPKDNAPPVDVE